MVKTCKNHKNVSNIRFPGFTDAWEQRKIGDQMYIKSRIGWQALTRKEYLETGDYYLITGTDIDETTHTVDLSRCYYVSKERYDMDDKIKVREGDIIVTKDGTIGKVAMVTGLDKPATINSHLFVLRDLSGTLDNRFLLQLLNSSIFDAFVENTKTGSTLTGLPQKTFVEFKFNVPQIDEQKKIADFLTNLDNLIFLHQRKCGQLKEYKKGLLQKMFPREGEKVPEIRFSGCTAAWEQYKVAEIGEIYIGLVTTMTSHYTDHGALLIRNSDIKDGRFEFGDTPLYLDDEFAKQNASRKHKVGDVITVHTGDIGTSAVITEKEAGSIGFATIVTRPYQEKIISEYLCAFLNTDMHKNFALNISTGDGRNNYNLKDYYECVVPVPCLAEQEKISGFIDGLNNLITLHQCKCNQLKEYKKGLLQQMFV